MIMMMIMMMIINDDYIGDDSGDAACSNSRQEKHRLSNLFRSNFKPNVSKSLEFFWGLLQT